MPLRPYGSMALWLYNHTYLDNELYASMTFIVLTLICIVLLIQHLTEMRSLMLEKY